MGVQNFYPPGFLLPPKKPFDATFFLHIVETMNKASTFRLHEDVQAGLELISQLQHRPKNKLVNEAVAEYVTRHAIQTDEVLHDILKRINVYQESDPGFDRAIDSFVEAEASYGKREDPMEGEPAISNGPVTKGLRQLIDA